MILRNMLGSSDKDLTSHAMKVTGLSWSAKAEMPREQRRLLGRHASAIKGTDSVFSRDLAFAPVRAFQKVLTMIQGGIFHPDEPRSQYFTGANLMAPGTPMPTFQPATPAFLSEQRHKLHRRTGLRQPRCQRRYQGRKNYARGIWPQ